MLTLFAFAIIFILFTLGYLGIDKLEHYFKTLNKWSLYFDHAVPDPYMGLYIQTHIGIGYRMIKVEWSFIQGFKVMLQLIDAQITKSEQNKNDRKCKKC